MALCQKLGLELLAFMDIVLQAMKGISAELGL
jgi:predicted hydrolase (HD superfamily)